MDNLEKVLERLATSEKLTIVVAREIDGKMRVTSGSWEGEKVFYKDQVLEVRSTKPLSGVSALSEYLRYFRRLVGITQSPQPQRAHFFAIIGQFSARVSTRGRFGRALRRGRD